MKLIKYKCNRHLFIKKNRQEDLCILPTYFNIKNNLEILVLLRKGANLVERYFSIHRAKVLYCASYFISR